MDKKLLGFFPRLENGIVFVRIVVGVIMIKYGWEIVNAKQMQGYVAWLTDVHFPAPGAMAYLGKVAELAGGLLLALGLWTRLACVALLVDACVITFVMGHGKIWGEDQLPFLLLLLFLTFFFTGGGKWSLDRLLFKR
jgi:putative oxidoreductase